MGRSVADVAVLWSVMSGRPVPEPRLDGLTVGLLRQAPYLGDGRETEQSDAAEQWVAELERLGARVVEAAIAGAEADMWPLFLSEAAHSHRETFPSRADEYTHVMQVKLDAANRVAPADVERAYEAMSTWRALRPEVDLFVSPCFAVELPVEDANELEVRLPLSSFLRWVNLIGWAGLAIGNLQLVAPSDEVVLAAGLAWERGERNLREPADGGSLHPPVRSASPSSCVVSPCCSPQGVAMSGGQGAAPAPPRPARVPRGRPRPRRSGATTPRRSRPLREAAAPRSRRSATRPHRTS